MDTIDKKILTLVNRSLPLEERPYEKIAGSLGITGQEVVERVRRMHKDGIIRRIGAVIDPRRIGWHSTLCAAEIPEERIEEYAACVNSYPEVTHNYVRSGSPNCWFTLIAPDRDRSREIISEIEHRLEVEVLDLPTSRVFKIRVAFDIE